MRAPVGLLVSLVELRFGENRSFVMAAFYAPSVAVVRLLYRDGAWAPRLRLLYDDTPVRILPSFHDPLLAPAIAMLRITTMATIVRRLMPNGLRAVRSTVVLVLS